MDQKPSPAKRAYEHLNMKTMMHEWNKLHLEKDCLLYRPNGTPTNNLCYLWSFISSCIISYMKKWDIYGLSVL